MIKSKGYKRELPRLSVFLLKTDDFSAQQRFTAIWATHPGTGRPDTPHLVPSPGDTFIRPGEVLVGTNLTEKQGRMALDASVYVDSNGRTQFNREYLFPPFESLDAGFESLDAGFESFNSKDAGYDYRNQ